MRYDECILCLELISVIYYCLWGYKCILYIIMSREQFKLEIMNLNTQIAFRNEIFLICFKTLPAAQSQTTSSELRGNVMIWGHYIFDTIINKGLYGYVKT